MNRRIDVSRSSRFFVDDLIDHRRDVLSWKRLFSGNHFVQDHAQRENVAAAVDDFSFYLFGRHIAGSAHDVRRLLNGAKLQNLCRTEVGDFQGVVRREHQVRRFNLLVDDVSIMSELQRAAGLFHDA